MDLPPGTLVIIAFVATAFLVILAGGLAGLMVFVRRKTTQDIETQLTEKLSKISISDKNLHDEFVKLHQQVGSLTRELAALKKENALLITEVASLTKEVNRLHNMIPPELQPA